MNFIDNIKILFNSIKFKYNGQSIRIIIILLELLPYSELARNWGRAAH